MALSTFILTDYRGLSSITGREVSGDDHLRQSLRDLLTTPIGSRVMRRDYGSRIPSLVDAPMNAALRADLVAATAEAIQRFEPRVKLKSVSVREVRAGAITLDLVVETAGRTIKLEGVV